MVACPGGPILEIPRKGRFIFERLSPGTIREEDFYEEFRIVPGGGGTKLLVACPRGQTRNGRCRVGQRALRIWHDRRAAAKLIRDCVGGRLGKRRRGQMERIRKDIERLKAGGSFGRGLNVGLFEKPAVTALGRLGQFALSAVLGTLVSVVVIRLFFPGVLTPAQAATDLKDLG